MPSFCNCGCGGDEYICQSCGQIFCESRRRSTWMIVPGKTISGNVCSSCVSRKKEPVLKRTIKELKEHACGFISEEELEYVVAEKRLQPCLVRCGGGRFVTPAQDVKHFIDIIEKDGRDYVRDVSLQ